MTGKDVLKLLRSLGIPEFIPEGGKTGTEKGGSSFGQINSDVLISHAFFPEHTLIQEHVHEQFVICFVRKGSALQIINGREYPVKTGEITIILPEQKHSLIVQKAPLDITEVIITDYKKLKT